MKVVLLAGGFGTRISEESHLKPKPMIEIGGKPLLWHIMKEYSEYGYNDFIICLGYKSYVVKEYFSNYYLHASDITFDLTNNKRTVRRNFAEPWRVTLIDTGLNTMTGGRIKRIQEFVEGEPFLLTYGDGVSDINIAETVKFHKAHNKLVTMSVVNVASRFGVIKMDSDNCVRSFSEKSLGDGTLINAGYMVCNPKVFDYIEGDDTVFEKAPLEKLAADGELVAYKHDGFWQCMDTQRDKEMLEKMWASGQAKWKSWND